MKKGKKALVRAGKYTGQSGTRNSTNSIKQ